MTSNVEVEKVPIQEIQLGDVVFTTTASGEPNHWQVNSKNTEWSEETGQIITLKPKPADGATQVPGIRAPLGSLVHRVKRQ